MTSLTTRVLLPDDSSSYAEDINITLSLRDCFIGVEVLTTRTDQGSYCSNFVRMS